MGSGRAREQQQQQQHCIAGAAAVAAAAAKKSREATKSGKFYGQQQQKLQYTMARTTTRTLLTWIGHVRWWGKRRLASLVLCGAEVMRQLPDVDGVATAEALTTNTKAEDSGASRKEN